MEIFKKGVKEWERRGCFKKEGFGDGEGAVWGGFGPPPNILQAEDKK